MTRRVMLPGQIKKPPPLETPATKQPVSNEQPTKIRATSAMDKAKGAECLSIHSVTRAALGQLY